MYAWMSHTFWSGGLASFMIVGIANRRIELMYSSRVWMSVTFSIKLKTRPNPDLPGENSPQKRGKGDGGPQAPVVRWSVRRRGRHRVIGGSCVEMMGWGLMVEGDVSIGGEH